MRKNSYFLIGLIFVLATAFGQIANAVAEQDDTYTGIYTNEYYLSIFPDYPPVIGEEVTLRLRTFKPAQKVTLYSDREKEIPMVYRDGYWWGKFEIPADYKEGGHFFTAWIRYPFVFAPKQDFFSKISGFFGLRKKLRDVFWSQSVVWYPAVKEKTTASAPRLALDLRNISFEADPDIEEMLPIVTGEAFELKIPSGEAVPFIIKGSKTLTFSSKNIEGSKEGFVPGVTREEALRLNISGKTDGTEIDANLISTSTAGTSQVAQREDKVSVLVKRASTEAYLGDFTADLTETEFTKLNKVLSGARVRGDYGSWGFTALYSSPPGQSKFSRMYGDGTQGPFHLDSAPVVINSERVTVDGAPQKRGDDYTIDYQAGTVTFSKKTIDPKSIINIYYDFRQTVYQHSTYGLRLTGKPKDNVKIGATYLNDSDSLTGAAEIRGSMSQEAVNPAGHYVVGADGSLVSEALTANGEVAYSNKNLNLFSAGNEETGKAIKLDVSSQLGPFGLKAFGKRVGAKFEPIAEAAPKQDVTEYGGGLSWRPGSLFGSQGNYSYEKYTLSDVVYENRYKSAKAVLTPERFPSLEYNFSEDEASNDPVSGNSIQRIITRHSAESLYRLGFLSTALKATKEKWLNRSPSEEATYYKKVNFGLATAGLEKVTFTSNVELEDREEPTGDRPFRKTYNVNLSASPSKSYFVSTSIEHLDDSAQGVKDSTDVSYRAEPADFFKTEGKYTVQSVSEDFVTSEAVAKHSGSFSFDLRPARYLRLRYLFKPNFTQILRTGTRSFNNEQQQAEINLVPVSEVMLGLIYKVGHSFNIYRQDAPNYTVKDNTADSDSKLYTLKLAPFRIFSTEFNYLLESGATTQRVTAEPLSYLPGVSANKKFDAIVKTSLSERFSIDSRYTYQRATQGTGEAASNTADSTSHTASLKGIWNISDAWSVSASGGYTKTINYLSITPVTYTFSPGWGFIFRQGDRVRVDFDYTYSRSYAGAETEKTNYTLRAKYSLSDYVNVTIRGERELGRAPDYRLTDITGNIEINL
ncbi:MAG: hypothetical protein PHG97_05870 [Candidatus Margulisbacteria bacterium]|nr:hypothetical protein [Candidatus Margulisiibacteriota bacterium]